MFRFEEPLYLYLLLLIPLLAGLHYAQTITRKRLLRYGDIELLSLMPDVSTATGVRWAWLMLAAGIVDIPLARPPSSGQNGYQ